MKERNKILFFIATLFLGTVLFTQVWFAKNDGCSDNTGAYYYTWDEWMAGFFVETININDKVSIISGFCDAILKSAMSEKAKELSTWANVWDAIWPIYTNSWSVFLYLLCANWNDDIDHSEKFQKVLKEDYVKLKNLNNSIFPKNCRKSYASCDISLLADTIITQLFSEIVTLKEADIMLVKDLNLSNEDHINKIINQYWEEKYWISVSEARQNPICWNKQHRYDQTCSIIKKHMKAFPKVIKKFKILDGEKIYEKRDENKISCWEPKNSQEYDLIYCWTIWSWNTNNWLYPTIWLMYNELLWYTIFWTFYETTLEEVQERWTQQEQRQDEIAAMQENLTKYQKITNKTIQDLSNFIISYPMHIGFLIMQEDFLYFRDKSLSKIITPIYTIYNKLRNVQYNLKPTGGGS